MDSRLVPTNHLLRGFFEAQPRPTIVISGGWPRGTERLGKSSGWSASSLPYRTWATWATSFFWREKIFETSKRMPGDSPFLGIKHQILEINWLTFFDGDLTMNKCQLGDLSINLVGGWAYPSEKYARQLGWLFSIYGKMKNVPNHQPVNNVGD